MLMNQQFSRQFSLFLASTDRHPVLMLINSWDRLFSCLNNSITFSVATYALYKSTDVGFFLCSSCNCIWWCKKAIIKRKLTTCLKNLRDSFFFVRIIRFSILKKYKTRGGFRVHRPSKMSMMSRCKSAWSALFSFQKNFYSNCHIKCSNAYMEY